MKQKLASFSQRYADALGRQLKLGPQASLQPALALGQEAVSLGLETLDLARLHEQALVALNLSNLKNAFTKLAGIFFAEANGPIDEAHSVAHRSRVQFRRIQENLAERTKELADSNRQLQRGLARRKVMQDSAHKKNLHYKKCLEESLQLQKRLRQLTHRVLLAQEDDRRSISLALHDEIAQTLLGINVRLLSLKQEARVNQKGLKSGIANTQRLVVKSVKSVRRVARELGDL